MALYIASIDVQKTFDVIRYELLLDRLYQLGLRGAWWRLKESTYTDLKERVMWHGVMSETFPIMLGSRQGTYPSPDDYLSYLCKLKLLFMSFSAQAGYSIGSIKVTTPTCADDMIIMASSALQLQALILLATIYANEERYIIHPKKTVIVPFNI